MPSIDELNEKHGLDDVATFQRGRGDLTKLAIRADAAEADVYLHGAHVTHFQPAGEQPLLFLSEASAFEAGKPIRGGIPVCFPWFGPHPKDDSLPSHGFARLRPWQVREVQRTPAGATVTLRLASDEQTRTAWPHDFVALLTVDVASQLTLTWTVENTGNAPFTYEQALHSYFRVADVREVMITGLEQTEYIDKVDDAQRKRQGAEPIRFARETDRPYLSTDAACILEDPGLGRRITVSKIGSQSTVVWNPWTDKAARMPDFGDDEWPHMVCIETANVADNEITLNAGESHEMSAVIDVSKGS